MIAVALEADGLGLNEQAPPLSLLEFLGIRLPPKRLRELPIVRHN